MSRKIILTIVLLFSSSLWAHETNDATLNATMELYAQIAEMNPSSTDEIDHSVASVKLAGQSVELNSAFWQLVRGWIRIYYKELHAECTECLHFSEDQLVAAAEDQIARSFFSTKLSTPAAEGMEHIAVGAADVGARFGKTALIAKLTAETAETVISKTSLLGGMHFVCHLIDAFIIFYTRKIQTATRAYSWAGVFDGSSIASSVKTALVARAVARAQRRVHFVAGPIELSDDELKEVDAEGPNRWWGIVSHGKRAAWIKKLVKHGHTKVARREFLGTRMKRYLWLKGRRRGHRQFMKGRSEMDQSLTPNLLWILQLQESVVQRSLSPKGQELELLNSAQTATELEHDDEIRHGLAVEFAANDVERTRFVESLLQDVELIFDPSVASRVRYFHASVLENLLAGFMYGQFSTVLNNKSEVYGSSFRGIWNQVQLRWKVGRFAGYIYEWTDFLRLAALQRDEKMLLRHKYEAMESLLRLLKYFNATAPLVSANSKNDLSELRNTLSNEYDNLMTFRPWKPKRVAYSWWPWRTLYPSCRELDRGAVAR